MVKNTNFTSTDTSSTPILRNIMYKRAGK